MVEIYVDILIILNFIIDFFLLNLVAKISNSNVRLRRIILSSFLASLFSLYIFLPSQNFFIELLLRIIFSLVVVFCCFGFSKFKIFFRRFLLFYLVSFIFAGVMIAIWFLFKPSEMAINNGIVYFDFSPITLVVSTAVCYLILCIIRHLLKPESNKAKRLKLSLILDNKSVNFISAVDTGNNLREPISNSPVIVVDKKIMKELLMDKYDLFIIGQESSLLDRYRVIPITTVGGGGILTGLKCDYLKYNNKLIEKPIIAESKTKFSDDYSAVLNPDILEV